jgi:quercetin dioxygenase-like cupin family protein
MKTLVVALLAFTIWAVASTQSMLPPLQTANAEQLLKPKLENLRSDKLAGVENTEVIVSRVAIPPHTRLPKHWHPGEEFAYVIEGSVTLWQEGKADITGKAGDVIKVPLEQIHSAKTNDAGALLLVFRVHQSGKQERYLVD